MKTHNGIMILFISYSILAFTTTLFLALAPFASALQRISLEKIPDEAVIEAHLLRKHSALKALALAGINPEDTAKASRHLRATNFFDH